MEFPTAAARRWWPLLAGTGVGVVVGAALFATTPTSYSAQTTLFLGSPVSTDSAGAYAGDLFSQQRAVTYAQMFESNDLAVKVIDDLSLPTTPAALVAEVSAKQVPKTVLLQVTITDRSAQRAADIANDYASNFSNYVARLETPAASAQPDVAITVVQKASVPVSPAVPSAVKDLGGGLVAGLLLGGAGMWLRRRLDRSVSDTVQIARATGVDVLGELPTQRRRTGSDPRTGPVGAYAEALRTLRTNLTYLAVDNPPRMLLLAGPNGTESGTATTAELAVVFGELGRTVLVVGADLRTANLTGYLGLEPTAIGLSQVLSDRASLETAIVATAHANVDALPAGEIPVDPSELLASEQTAKVLDALRTAYDLVLIDAPALLRFTDAAVLGARVDGVLLLARPGRTSADELERAATALRRVGARLLGTVLV